MSRSLRAVAQKEAKREVCKMDGGGGERGEGVRGDPSEKEASP